MSWLTMISTSRYSYLITAPVLRTIWGAVIDATQPNHHARIILDHFDDCTAGVCTAMTVHVRIHIVRYEEDMVYMSTGGELSNVAYGWALVYKYGTLQVLSDYCMYKMFA